MCPRNGRDNPTPIPAGALTQLLCQLAVPVMGCTEPAAIALAVALAAEAARGQVPAWAAQKGPQGPAGRTLPFTLEAVQVRTVRSLYKNALAVGIPNTQGGSGIYLAAALGPFLDPNAALNLLKGIDNEALDLARSLLGSGRLGIIVQEHGAEGLFVEAQVIGVFDGERHVGEAMILGEHDAVTRLRQDGRLLLHRPPAQRGDAATDVQDLLHRLDMDDLLALVRQLDEAGRSHALLGIRMNRAAAEEGIAGRLGLGVGAHLHSLIQNGTLAADVATRASLLCAGATDARMSGHDVEIMSSSGSGNQGIMVVLPVLAVAEAHGLSEDAPRFAEAVALAHLVTSVMTRHTGLLSALCGCVVKAGLGAAAGCGHILGLDGAGIFGALRNMAGNMTGEICDGAKVGCAVKLSTAARAAVLSAYQARDGVTIPPSNGILASSLEALFINIGEVAHSMREVDRAIVAIMEKKQLEESSEK